MVNSDTEMKSAVRSITSLEKELELVKGKFIDAIGIPIEDVVMFPNTNLNTRFEFESLEKNLQKKDLENCMFVS